MAFDFIHGGDKIEIFSARDPNSLYASRVINIIDLNNQILSMYTPVLAGKSLTMNTADEYSAVVSTNHLLLRFPCTFEGYLKEELNYFVAIKLEGDGAKLQRREFFRFTCMLAMKFSVLDFEDNEAARVLHASGYAAINDAIVRDIGGGGMRFITKAELDPKFHIQCTIMLGTTTIRVKCKIIEKQDFSHPVMKYQYRALYQDIPEQTQEEIVGYIFAEQRKRRKTTASSTSGGGWYYDK